MVSGAQKSRTFRKAYTRLPSGKLKVHYHRRKPGKAQCAECGDYLKGVVRENPGKIAVPKSQRRPERPYGGVLCSRCMRKTITSRFRNIFSLK